MAHYSTVEYLQGSSFRVYYPDEIQEAVINAIKAGRLWEKKLINRYKNMIKSGDTVLDIGSYLGTHAVCFSQLVGDSGIVHCFEPQTDIYSLLEKTIKENEINNVKLYNKAVYNKIGTIEFSNTNNGKASISHIRPRLPKPVKKMVETVTVDSLALNRCDFIKMDIEMCEWVALAGAEETIQAFKPIIFLETFKTPKNLIKLKDWCESHKYKYENIGGADFILEKI